jgi:hypothetical protein
MCTYTTQSPAAVKREYMAGRNVQGLHFLMASPVYKDRFKHLHCLSTVRQEIKQVELF